MIKRCMIAVMVAALLAVQMPGGARANERGKDHEQGDQRDGQSRYELAPLNYLPLVMAAAAREQIVRMYFLLQTISYIVDMTTGVEVTSQNRVSLGGLFGGVFAPTYSSKHFLRSLEVGTVYNAGDGLLAVAMAGGEVLADHRVIVFNGDYQYNPRSLPTLQQIAPEQMQKLQAYSLMSQLATYALGADVMNLMASLSDADAAQLNGTAGLTAVQRETEIPALRKLIVGKVYRGPDNTLLVVIPPAIVLDR